MGRAYTIEERKAFLNKMYELGKPPREAAKELGVCATSLYCWGKQHDAHRYYEF
ncbi:transposase [Gallibacterium anatis]|uniref:Transposase n=2 Tax=Gallibacterium anatis TaxID=750 RepID=A0A930URP4_9PAST|nr:transposase [Gallibacterium anatis]